MNQPRRGISIGQKLFYRLKSRGDPGELGIAQGLNVNWLTYDIGIKALKENIIYYAD